MTKAVLFVDDQARAAWRAARWGRLEARVVSQSKGRERWEDKLLVGDKGARHTVRTKL